MRFTLLCGASRWTLSSQDLTAWFDPNFPYSSRIDFLGQESWDTQPNCVDSFNYETDPFTPLFFVVGCTSTSTCRNRHLSPYVHLDSDRHMGGCQKLRIRALSLKGMSARNSASCFGRALSSAAWTFWGYLSVSLCRRFWCRRGRLSFMSLIASASRCGIMTETTWVSFRTLSNCFPLFAFSTFCAAYFSTISFRVSRSRCLINMTSYWCLQSGIA